MRRGLLQYFQGLFVSNFCMEHELHEDEAESPARNLWDTWEGTNLEVMSEDEFAERSGLNQEMGSCLGRMLSSFDKDKHISLSGLAECFRVLKGNIVEERVRLLFKFMDSERSGRISHTDTQKYLWMMDERAIERLEFRFADDTNHSFAHEDLLRAFQNSSRGEAAINFFCHQVLKLLSQSAVNANADAGSLSPTRRSSALLFDRISHFKETFTSHLTKEQVFSLELVLLQMMFWLINFFYYLRTRHMPLSFCIAKGFGLNLRVLTIAMYATMMRRTMGYLYNFSRLRPFLPLGFNVQVHSFLGFCLVFHAFGHMCGHIAYFECHVKRGFAEAFTQESLLRTGSWARRGKGDAITGYLLLSFLLLMAGTALYRGKSSQHFRAFFLVHYLYNMWPVFIFLHVPDLWPYFLSITGAIVLERAYDFFYMTNFSTLAASRACSHGVTFLSVPRGRDTSPGCYYRIKIPAISCTEWHPFSLAGSVSSHHLTFFVASVGDWTHALYQIVSDPVLRGRTMVQVQGPFAAPAKWAVRVTTEPPLLVASGIGITPFFSLMATKVADELNFQSDNEVYQELFQEEVSQRRRSVSTVKAIKSMSLEAPAVVNTDLQELRVVWMIRDCGELLFYLDYVHQLVKSQDSLSRHVVYVDVYLTGLGKGSDPVQMVAQTLFLLTVSDLTSAYMNIHFGRPDLSDIFEQRKPKQVYYCGGVVMKSVLSKLCQEHGAQFHPEDCGSSPTFIPCMEKKWSEWRAWMVKRVRKKVRLSRKTVRQQSMNYAGAREEEEEVKGDV